METQRHYNAFISYRKISSVNADFIRQCILAKSAYSSQDIFLDKHSIGPELFDNKIKKAISESKCIVLLVTKDCFKSPKDNQEDWFIEEIKTGIALGKKIIPVLFDKIDSLSDIDILSDLNKNFNQHEVEILRKSQSVTYNTEYSEASIEKLVNFIDEANKTNSAKESIVNILQISGILLALIISCFTLFFGLGALWGYCSSSAKSANVLQDNTIIDEKEGILHFEYRGWKATYDLDKDTIILDLANYDNTPKIGNTDLVLASFTISGAKFLLERNISYLKYLRFLKGGSKPAKIAFACASAAVCVGAFCGFSQGSRFGQAKRQEETALALYPKLQKRSTWRPLFKNNTFLSNWYLPDIIITCDPIDNDCIAFKAGFNGNTILLEFNNWEIGVNNYNNLQKVIADSKEKEKHFVFLSLDDLSISEYHLPAGVVGVVFSIGPESNEMHKIARCKYLEWRNR